MHAMICLSLPKKDIRCRMGRSIEMDTLIFLAVFPFLLQVQVYLPVLELMAIRFEGCVANQVLSTTKDVGPTQMRTIPSRPNQLDCRYR